MEIVGVWMLISIGGPVCMRGGSRHDCFESALGAVVLSMNADVVVVVERE